MSKPKISVSVGDLNGVGIEIILKAHKEISQYCTPVYCINKYMLQQASKLLHVEIPDDFQTSFVDGDFNIEPGKVSAKSGNYSFDSFMHAVRLCETKETQAVVTMPIHKEAWMMAGLEYKGHTDALRKYFKKDAIMMLGCEEMFVALFTEHIPLKDVASSIEYKKLKQFFLDLHSSIPNEKIAVLGLNPHAGDNGVLGDEELIIHKALKSANIQVGFEQFIGPIVPDIAFTPEFRKKFKYFVAMYHDQGLAPLKALYFDESINISLNLPIIRTSVDHGTAFDIAYKGDAKTLSYINAVKNSIKTSH
ncbi:4-hydroxythreonine-4-phosphate dehydrogenase [Candidatus Sulfurimonas baltica]|uniref:4-hydroxythreonine-4-phosphate dehydrogenase n=1 Tax=Candidatus Sulfurimonas baltica TaxID=2740404 RepID=A0A7S7LT31_9BACT|nr:4-hydroxythreonine-4-phosphate dehydrogenase [Candidatus Sulfurimonas baltica]QOY51051.1 4-hydroxythreonine-4-phosphate dehydrogenase [Candidatus Sulfurimonas baltica]